MTPTQALTLAAAHLREDGHHMDADEAAKAAAILRLMADDTPRWAKLDALREMARQFVSHPLSRGISDCEEAGELMAEAAAEIERLCRVRNCLAGSARDRVARLQQLEAQRDYLLGELCRIDNDPGNSGHYASEAIAAICAEEGARDVSKECTCSAADMPFGRCCKMKNNLPSRDWS